MLWLLIKFVFLWRWIAKKNDCGKGSIIMCVNTAWQKANLCGCAGLSFGSLDFLYKHTHTHTHNLIYKKNT